MKKHSKAKGRSGGVVLHLTARQAGALRKILSDEVVAVAEAENCPGFKEIYPQLSDKDCDRTHSDRTFDDTFAIKPLLRQLEAAASRG